jgi:hypothetical protein
MRRELSRCREDLFDKDELITRMKENLVLNNTAEKD